MSASYAGERITKEIQFDQARSEAFAEKLLGLTNGAALSLMISIGHRTGLFDALAKRADFTSNELAQVAGLNERYVREWLGAIVTGSIIEYTPTIFIELP